jgi:hypothetical protein
MNREKGCSHLLNYLLPLLCLCATYSFSQRSNGATENEFSREIVVEESGIHAISRNSTDTIVMDLDNNAVLYCYPDSTLSFWYKIYAKKDCEISFDIFPDNADNTYNFFLYKNKGDFNINDIRENNIYPVRANLFKDEMAGTGTGLSHSTSIDYRDTSSKVREKQFYHTAYHSAVPAIKGDVFLLNIYHIKGTDCGQQFVLQTNIQSQKFQSLYKTCYSKHVASVKTDAKVKLPPVIVQKPALVQQHTKATYQVWDSLKHTVIEAEINWTKKFINSYTTVKGSGEIFLEKNTVYNVFFSALGYKSKKVTFITKDSIPSFTHYIFLTPVMQGEDFVMDKIYFYPNTYAIKPGATAEMDKLLKYLLANPEVKVEIQGYTNGNNRIKASPDDMTEGSFTGSSKKLSQLRSEIIKKYLTDNGVAGDRLIANGYGGSQMIYPKPKNQEEANKNIRVGVLILSKNTPITTAQKK